MPIRSIQPCGRFSSGGRAWPLMAALVLSLPGMAACGASTPAVPPTEPPTEAVEPSPEPPTEAVEPSPEPQEAPPEAETELEATPTYSYAEVTALQGVPEDSPEATFELYLRDSIAQLERLQQDKLDLRAHYESRAVLEQDLGGLIVTVDLIEDRSVFRPAGDNTVVVEGNFEVLATYANQDTRVFRCDWTVNLERAGDRWYVLGPTELPLFQVCTS